MSVEVLSRLNGLAVEQAAARQRLDDGSNITHITYADHDPDVRMRELSGLIGAQQRLLVPEQLHAKQREAAEELVELRHPTLINDKTGAKEDAIREYVGDEVDVLFGNFVFFPYDNRLDWYPEENDHWDLSTARRQILRKENELITNRFEVAAAFVGLSVGSNILYEAAKEGFGTRYIIADPDNISYTNLARMHASVRDVGERKVDHFARLAARINPYLEVKRYADGATWENLQEMMLAIKAEHEHAFVFEEADVPPVKLMTRAFARENELPVLMVTDAGDYADLYVQRFDLNPDAPLFGDGSIATDLLTAMMHNDPSLDKRTKDKLLVRMIGEEVLSWRLLRALALKEEGLLPSFMQLGSTARMGASIALRAAEAIANSEQNGEHVPIDRMQSEPPFYPGMRNDRLQAMDGENA